VSYSLNPNDVFVPDVPVAHRDEEYDSVGFDLLRDMQGRHFWYRGRHRFLLRALRMELNRLLLFVTSPALRCLWSYNDDMAHHVRRYAKSDFGRLAATSGLLLRQARYFMFFLSPLLWLSRLRSPKLSIAARIRVRAFDRARRTAFSASAGRYRLNSLDFGRATTSRYAR
jgi:hypothetical protein